MALPRRLVKLGSSSPLLRRRSAPLRHLVRHNSSYKYTPPAAPPATFSSSGIPQDAHPMPHDMPREDYSSPALYTFDVLGRIVKYIILGTVTIGTLSLIGVEGAHQYVERVMLAIPAHLDFMDSFPDSTTDTAGSATLKQHRDHLTPQDEDYYAWAEENDSWTGGSAGGTSSLLGFTARHALRSAWICQTWGQGLTGSSIAREGGDLGGGRTQVMKGMIGSDARVRTNRAEAALKAGVNVVDPGYEMAEMYIANAIAEAKKKGVVFPEELSVMRETFPREGENALDTPSTAPAPSRIAVDMMIRHAEVLERIGTPAALHRSQEVYERVLRSVLPYTNRQSVAAFQGATSQVPRQDFIAAVREAEVLRLAKKIGDVNARIGDNATARGWWTWGLSRVGLEHPAAPSLSTNQPPGIAAVLQDAAKPGWFDGWFGRKPRAQEDGARGVVSAFKDAAPRIQELGTSSSMDKTLKANMSLVPSGPPGVSSISAWGTIPPPLQRSVVALLESYSTHLAISGDLAIAERYQTLGLDIAQASFRRNRSTRELPAASLHNSWLQQRAALLTLHKAEVQYALRSKTHDIDDTLAMLGSANVQAEIVIKELTTGPSAAPASDAVATLSLDPHQGVPLRSMPLSATYNGPHSTERVPATQLLKDAQRTAAESWNITGLIYESLARSQQDTPAPLSRASEFEELAMDSFERAMGWNKIAYGGRVTGHHDVTDGEDVVGPANGLMTKAREYWTNYARVKSRLDRGLQSL
ncbi:hypothetical protein NliqN6_4197 [Naganishia liquefaciens]|uniref:Uncharacterized protein n=1 Tax=Naganishia liquefaciens TaxID=104408 RepID=A0A8H3TW14_9TREE|nr:hypothetical protein NliqN6_4197 [Naganishia liquefaciens]